MKIFNKTLLASACVLAALTSSAYAADGCTKGNPYPPSMVKSFMKGCASKPEFKGFCECTIEKLSANMSLYDFVEVGNTSAQLQKDPRFVDATSSCMDRIKAPAPAKE